jgi:hypothetical protein
MLLDSPGTWGKQLAQVGVGTKLGDLDGGRAFAQHPRDFRTRQTGQPQLDDAGLVLRELGQERVQFVIVVGMGLHWRQVRHLYGGSED